MNNRKAKFGGLGMALIAAAAVYGLLMPGPALAVDSTGHFSRAKVAWERGEYDNALAEYQAVINLIGDDAAARHNRALIFLELGRAPEARDEASRAVELSPEEGRYRLTLGVALMSLREPDWEAAREEFLSAIKPMKYDKDEQGLLRVYYNLGLVAQQGRLIVSARKWYRMALKIDPNDEATLTALASLEGRER
jgi:tetratricopeptide (TPR) repeat protein